jgi:predicted dehydrogenase
MRTVNVGLIGHKFMGKAHSHALHDLSFFFDTDIRPVMKTLCGVGSDLEETARRYGWQNANPDWKEVVEDPEIDLVDIAVPESMHMEIALAAAANGKHILCEKPMALTYAQTVRMYEAAKAAGVKHMVDFNYRALPAIRLARQLISEGKIGRIVGFKAQYMQDWGLSDETPFLWRMDEAMAGRGPAEAGCHIVDLARYLVGEAEQVAAARNIIHRERTDGATGKRRTVTSEDNTVFIARFKNEALGFFETSRVTAGRRNALLLEINGLAGSIRFNLERLDELELYLEDDPAYIQGFRTIIATQPQHMYIKNWWPAGHLIGWEHTFVHQYYEFMSAIAAGAMPEPNFYDGMKCQQVIEAVWLAGNETRWVKVDDIV